MYERMNLANGHPLTDMELHAHPDRERIESTLFAMRAHYEALLKDEGEHLNHMEDSRDKWRADFNRLESEALDA